MHSTLDVRVITPGRVVWEGEARSVRYPGEDGLYGVLPNHAPMITTVDAGVVTLAETSGTEHHLFVSRGFAQVRDGMLRFAVDSGEDETEIDVDRAERAAARARDRLHAHRSPEVDHLRARYALRRALMRLRARQSR